ncbi:MAG: SpoIVB peptidase S55 [Acidobacteriota bacterium]|nr:SpoIVB peptidase S55 [Acidobacteriota bacterium]
MAGVLAYVAGCGVCCGQSPAEVKAVAMPANAPSGAKIFPLADVRRGLHGVAYTVFEGVTPEPMEVEILGVLTDAIGPGQDMILARLKGERPEYTGVVAGMSGSPVYIDGKLLGALSYRIGQFSKEPICGITPIEQMFQVRDGGDAGGMRVASVDGVGRGQEQSANTGVLRSPQNDKFGGGLQNVAGGGEVQPIETALVFGGFSREAVERFGDKFRALGMSPVAGLGGAAAAGTKQPEPLVPGSAVSAVLVRGDLSISGTCTVTYVDATRLLACGHPITQYGPVSMPMTKAEVVATLASPLNAFKIINTTETVGSFTEDRASAILGRFGVDAKMIPVSVEVVPERSVKPTHRDETAMNGAQGLGNGAQGLGNGAQSVGNGAQSFSNGAPESGNGTPAVSAMKQVSEQVGPGPKLTVPGMAPGLKGGMHFEVLNNRELTPQAMLVSVYQSLSGTNAAAAEISYRMSGELTLKGQPPVILRGIMAPNDANSGAIAAALYVNDRFGRLYGNSVEQPEVTGLRLRMEQIPERRTAVLEGARLGRTEVHAGETLDVEATLHPYQAEARVVHLAVKLPNSLPAGPMRIVVSDGATLDRLMTPVGTGFGGMTQHPIALGDAVAQMNRLHANDRIYVTLLDHSAMAELDAQALPEVPLSMANVLEPLKAAQKMQLTGESVVEAGSMETGYAVSGTHVLNLEVR